MAGDEKDPITVNLSRSLDPYEDEHIIETQPDDVPVLTQREPFNDVIKHGDIMVGRQRNRTLSDFRRGVRPWVRLSAILTLVVILGGVLWDIFF